MKAPVWKVRLIVLAAVCCCAALGTQPAAAQTATVSPGSLVFGVEPVNTPSGSQTVTFAVTGEGTVTLKTIMIQETGATDFSETDNCGIGNSGGVQFSSGHGCTVNVTFTPTATGTRSATLVFQTDQESNPGPVTLTGGVPSIKLFDSLLVNNSVPNTPGFPGSAVRSDSITLSCQAPPIATLSSSTDGSGFVFQDNYIRVTNPATETSQRNVCTGGDPNIPGPSGTTNCFQFSYESAAGGFIGKDPDTRTVGDASFVRTYGVQPLDVSNVLAQGSQTVTFELMDFGGFLGAATLNLVTNCTQTGVASGGTITSNPINSGDANSLTPTFPFDNTAGQHIFFRANYLSAGNADSGVTIQPNTIASIRDVGINQTVFPTLVAGTSAAPTVCLRYTGELDTDGITQLCKAFVIQCTNGTLGGSTPKGVNCAQSAFRNLLYESRFDSPDFPPGSNPIAEGTGPGFLMGPDVWTSATDCHFAEGLETGQLCPQNNLTEFKGAADPIPGGTSRGVNSTFIPVLNMPLPFTIPIVISENIFLWQDDPTVKVKFFAFPAKYDSDDNPIPANGFTAAPIQSVTFGTTRANVPVPDPTFPVAEDQTLSNTGTCPSTTAGLFTSTGTFALAEGRYKLHFFATDCTNTEELKFRASNDPNVNWANFKTVPVNVDLTPPQIVGLNLSTTSPKNGQTVTARFSCSDPVLADASPGSGVVFCGPRLFFAVANTGTVTVKFVASGKGSTKTFKVNATDLAGNTATASATYTVQ